jgi:3-oxoacyl-[acyl-carrier protein] reductase
MSTSTSVLVTDLSQHLALITGCTGGIGSATARTLAALGCSIAIHYHQNASAATSLREQLRSQHNVRAEVFQADLSSYDSTRKLHADVVDKLGHPSILFNNAGTTVGKFGVKKIEELSMDEFEAAWRTNCGTAYLLTQLCMSEIERRGWGRVIFCGSVAGFVIPSCPVTLRR